MKDMSFGKLMAIFGGSLVVVIILAVVVIKANSGPKPGTKVVTQRYQTQDQPQGPDILAEQLRREQEAAETAREMSAKQARAIEQAIQQQNQAVMQRLDGISTGMLALEQRVSAIENIRRPTSVQIIKPENAPRAQPVKKLERGAAQLPANSGYKVQATVGKRAWIAAGEHEDSVTVGETLPPVQKPWVVRAVDNESGIVVTSAKR